MTPFPCLQTLEAPFTPAARLRVLHLRHWVLSADMVLHMAAAAQHLTSLDISGKHSWPHHDCTERVLSDQSPCCLNEVQQHLPKLRCSFCHAVSVLLPGYLLFPCLAIRPKILILCSQNLVGTTCASLCRCIRSRQRRLGPCYYLHCKRSRVEALKFLQWCAGCELTLGGREVAQTLQAIQLLPLKHLRMINFR